MSSAPLEPPQPTNGEGTAAARETFAEEFRDAIAPRTVMLVVGVLLLQLGFIASYVGPFTTRSLIASRSRSWRPHQSPPLPCSAERDLIVTAASERGVG